MKRLLASTAVIGLAVAGIGTATAAAPFDKVTGGGQIFLDPTAPPQGPGATIAFTARNIGADNLAQGQLQYNDHAGIKFHGAVTCLIVEGTNATFAGTFTNAEGEEDVFQVDVQDNGQGQDPNDLIVLSYPDNANCESMTPDMELGRGNAQVHDAEA